MMNSSLLSRRADLLRPMALAALFALTTPVGASGEAASNPAASGLPKEVGNFIARREQCDHFRGEEASDPKRQATLDANLKSYCAGTDAKLASLKKKYRANKMVAKALSGFDPQIE